jgi:hypothetical protein
VPVRKLPDTSEHLTLEISRDKGALATVLSSKEDKTKALELPSDVNHIAGEPWIQGLSEGVAIDEIKITGTISTTWLMERLTKK